MATGGAIVAPLGSDPLSCLLAVCPFDPAACKPKEFDFRRHMVDQKEKQSDEKEKHSDKKGEAVGQKGEAVGQKGDTWPRRRANTTPASLALVGFLDVCRSSTDRLAGDPGEVVRGAFPKRVQGDEHAEGCAALQHGRLASFRGS